MCLFTQYVFIHTVCVYSYSMCLFIQYVFIHTVCAYSYSTGMCLTAQSCNKCNIREYTAAAAADDDDDDDDDVTDIDMAVALKIT